VRRDARGADVAHVVVGREFETGAGLRQRADGRRSLEELERVLRGGRALLGLAASDRPGERLALV